MARDEHRRGTLSHVSLHHEKREADFNPPLPPRYVKHGRRRKKRPSVGSPFLTVILLAFLSMVITLIVLSFWQLN